MSRLPEQIGLTTTELTLRQLRPAPVAGRLLARGRVLDPGPPLALAEASLTDDDGTLIAHATSLCLIVPVPLSDAVVSGDQDGVPDTPDPWRREPPVWERTSTVPPPLGQLTGLAAVSAKSGEATFSLPSTRWLCAPPPGRMQGGAVAMLAEAAIGGAVQTAAPAGAGFAAVELKVNYLRPLASDGRLALAHARVINAGRRFVVAGAEVRDADERLVAVASGSSMSATS